MKVYSLRYVLPLIALFIFSALNSSFGKVLYSFDFTTIDKKDPKTWLKEKGVEFQRDADDVKFSFSRRGLEIEASKELNGVFVSKVELKNAKSIRIKWGVEQYPKGANWEKNVLREAVAVLISFGEEKIDSGAFYIPDMPYFIGLFLGEKEIEGKAYTGNYYKKGGRYICMPCNGKKGKEVETVFYFEQAFKKFFNKEQLPPVSYFALEVDTRDTDGNSKAFIKSIEVHDD